MHDSNDDDGVQRGAIADREREAIEENSAPSVRTRKLVDLTARCLTSSFCVPAGHTSVGGGDGAHHLRVMAKRPAAE